MNIPFVITHRLFSAGFAWLDALGLLERIWSVLTFRLVDSTNMKVTAFRLAIGLTLFVVVFVLSGKLSSFLESRIGKREHIDPGLRYTITRLLRYLLVVIGIVAVLKGAFDLDLTSVAVLFTALSVGIGFGLQYIAADIASGFILLFERPVRVGDRITIGEDEGDVQSIRLRTTILYTNDRIAVIVPNSKLISQRIINWSYDDPRTRISIPVGVAYNSDVQLVTETLLLAAAGVESVLSDPPPKVQFLGFGDYSLNFRLLAWTRQPSHRPQMTSDINYRIDRLSRERSIEIPYPIQEFLLRTRDVSKIKDNLIAEEK